MTDLSLRRTIKLVFSSVARVIVPSIKMDMNNQEREHHRRVIRNWFAIFGLIFTAVVVSLNQPEHPVGGAPAHSSSAATNIWIIILLGAWAVMPGLWFLAEWAYFGPIHEDGDDGDKKYKRDVDDFKYVQSLSKTIWIAVLAVLALVYGVKFTGA